MPLARQLNFWYTDPAYPDPQFGSVAVLAYGFPQDEGQELENILEQLFIQQGVQAWTGVQLGLPSRQMSDEEIVQQFSLVDAETVLIVTEAETGIVESRAPIVFSPGRTYGGGTIRRPIRTYEASLLDVSNGATIWRGDAESRGGELANNSTLDDSLARELFDTLMDTGVFVEGAVADAA